MCRGLLNVFRTLSRPYKDRSINVANLSIFESHFGFRWPYISIFPIATIITTPGCITGESWNSWLVFVIQGYKKMNPQAQVDACIWEVSIYTLETKRVSRRPDALMKSTPWLSTLFSISKVGHMVVDTWYGIRVQPRSNRNRFDSANVDRM